MTDSRTTPAPRVELAPALPEQEPALANMFELYAHDFSEFIDIKLGADGRFGCEGLSSYWKEPGRHAFVVRADGHLAGFAFVHRGSDINGDTDVWDMAEFFVARGFRRLGVGTRAAREVWKRFPGRWEVRVIDTNRKAKEFWRSAISEFVGETVEPTPFSRGGRGWHVFSFESVQSA
jgi:predicted acetyltransferase